MPVNALSAWTDTICGLPPTLGEPDDRRAAPTRLIVGLDDGQIEYFLLDDCLHPADSGALVEALVAARDPAFAALVWPASLSTHAPADPRVARARAGTIRPEDVPRHERLPALALLAQDRALRTEYRLWVVSPDAPRRYTRYDTHGLSRVGGSVARTLFAFHEGMRPPYNLSEARARLGSRRAAISFLRSLGIEPARRASVWPSGFN